MVTIKNLQKVCNFEITDVNRARVIPRVTCIHMNIVKLSGISVQKAKNFLSIKVNEISVISITDISLMNFQVISLIDIQCR